MKIFLYIFLIIVAVLGYDTVRMFLLFKNTQKLEAAIDPFQKINPDAQQKILVLGDSTAYGTGATSNIHSTTGRLSSLYPDAEVINISENGLKLKGLNDKIKDIDTKYDLIVIQIGANDIIRFTSLSDVDLELQILLAKAKSLSDKVIILHSGNIGESEFFPWYVRPLLSSRTRKVRKIYLKETTLQNVSYVDLYDMHLGQENYANDKLHLNDAGYKVWFKEIIKKI